MNRKGHERRKFEVGLAIKQLQAQGESWSVRETARHGSGPPRPEATSVWRGWASFSFSPRWHQDPNRTHAIAYSFARRRVTFTIAISLISLPISLSPLPVLCRRHKPSDITRSDCCHVLSSSISLSPVHNKSRPMNLQRPCLFCCGQARLHRDVLTRIHAATQS